MNPHLTNTPVLETDRLILRAPAPQDFPVWESFFLSDRGFFIGGGPEQDEGRAWRGFASIIGHWVMHGCGVFALTRRDTGTAIGGCGPWYPALWPEREISWSVWDAGAEGQGFMAEAAAAVLAHVSTDLGWPTAVSYIDPDNKRSRALAQRMGAVIDPSATAPASISHVDVYRHALTGGSAQ